MPSTKIFPLYMRQKRLLASGKELSDLRQSTQHVTIRMISAKHKVSIATLQRLSKKDPT